MTLDSSFLARPIAHRGLHNENHGLIENSLGAARAAIKAGYGVEVDLQISSDGQAMVFHDETLDRLTTSSGWVADFAADDLEKLSLAGTEDKIPTLKNLLKLIDGQVPILIEMKDQTAHPGGALGPLEAATAEALEGYNGPVAIMSFHPGMVANIAKLAPGLSRGLTGMAFDEPGLSADANAALSDYAHFDTVGATFVSHHWNDLERPAISELKDRGVPILCWTIRSKEDELKAREIADNITFEGYAAD